MQKKVSDFYNLLEKIADATQNKTPSLLVHWLVKEVGIDVWLLKEGEEGRERLLNIQELVSLATRYDKLSYEEGLEKLLEDAALAADQDTLITERKKEGVKLMTVHASKGLEFPYVFIAGMEQGLFPYESFGGISDTNLDRAEEERRLFYVALTRAGKKIFLTCAGSRMIFGSRQANMPSEFLSDIPEHLVEVASLEDDIM